MSHHVSPVLQLYCHLRCNIRKQSAIRCCTYRYKYLVQSCWYFSDNHNKFWNHDSWPFTFLEDTSLISNPEQQTTTSRDPIREIHIMVPTSLSSSAAAAIAIADETSVKMVRGVETSVPPDPLVTIGEVFGFMPNFQTKVYFSLGVFFAALSGCVVPSTAFLFSNSFQDLSGSTSKCGSPQSISCFIC